MKGFGIKTKVGQRFFAILLIISLVPLAFVGAFAIRTAESALVQQTFSTLRAAADGAEAQLREFMADFHSHILLLIQDENLQQMLLTGTFRNSPASAGDPGVHAFLADQQRRIPDVQEVLLIAPDGRVLGSSAEAMREQNVRDHDYFIRGQSQFFAGDVYREAAGRVTWVMSAPVRNPRSGGLLGVIAFRVDPALLSDLTTGRRVLAQGADTQTFRIGNSGETYIVNRNGLMITESRYLPDAILNLKVDTLPVRTALDRGQEVTASYNDYRGIHVSGASIILRSVDWVVVTEVNFHQVFAPIRRLRNSLFAATVGLACVVGFLAWNSTTRIIRPVRLLSEADRALAGGDESAAYVPEEGLPQDELGEFVRQRNARIKAILESQRRLQERGDQLKQSLAEMEHMSYSMMHDMRAPLRALMGFGAIVLEEEADRLSPRGQEHLRRVRAAALRMDQFICDLLNYSRIARAELPLGPVSVAEVVRGVLDTYPALQERNLQVDIQSDIPIVQANEAALTQCFANLLDNAAKFVADGQTPRVTIRAESSQDRVRIWVEDTGVGIPPAIRERIFRIFERSSNVGESTGIGLAIVRKSVERMGGRVGVLSEPGQGSRFWIELLSAE